MKYGITAIIMAIVLYSAVSFAELSQEATKHKVTFTLTFNALTLDEAADKEALIQKRFKDACILKTKVEEVATDGQYFYISTDDNYTITTN